MSVVDGELRQTRRRRGTMLKFIRQGHEQQLSRMDDYDMWVMMLDLGMTMGRVQVLTMLQDLLTLGLIDYKAKNDEKTGDLRIFEIQLTAAGLSLVIRRKSTDEVLFD